MNQQKTKKCPFCKKKTSRNIDTCPHCKRIFVEKIGKNRPTKDYYQEVAKTNFSYQFNEEPASRAISFKFVLVVLFVIFLVYSFLFGEDDSSNINSTTTNPVAVEFPELIGPKMVTFKWKYNEKEYEISETFHNSIYQYYKTQPSKYYYEDEIPGNWTEDYYKMYVDVNENDSSFSNLLSAIKNEAEKNSLTENETVELILEFVQTIPYDDALASKMLNEAEDINQKRPYEVLYDNSGICGGKSFLAYVLLRNLGYGVALFDYEEDEHLAVGIKCSEEYSTYNSGYCYAETTMPGHLIGVIPERNPDDAKVVIKSEFNYFNEDTNSPETDQLNEGTLFLETEGRAYNGIKENLEMYNKIGILEDEIYDMEKKLRLSNNSISFNQSELEGLGDDLEYYESTGSIYAYNNLLPRYSQLLEKTNNMIYNYNNGVAIYDSKIDEVNDLVDDLY